MNIIKKHIEYLKDNPNNLWFKRKLYGWGWVPVTKEGWFVIVLYILALFFFASTVDDNSSTQEIMLMLVLPFIILTTALIRICYAKGESPKWMWGPEDNTKIGN